MTAKNLSSQNIDYGITIITIILVYDKAMSINLSKFKFIYDNSKQTWRSISTAARIFNNLIIKPNLVNNAINTRQLIKQNSKRNCPEKMIYIDNKNVRFSSFNSNYKQFCSNDNVAILITFKCAKYFAMNDTTCVFP